MATKSGKPQQPKPLVRLTRDEREDLRQQALAQFFPGVPFSSASRDGGLKLAYKGDLAVAICTERPRDPTAFHFGPRFAHLPEIAKAGLSYLLLCGVRCDANMVEQDRVFWALPLRSIGEDPEVRLNGKWYPLTNKSDEHYNVAVQWRNDEWVVSLGGAAKPLTGCDETIGEVYVDAHMRSAPKAREPLPQDILDLQTLLRELAVPHLRPGFSVHIHGPGY